MDSQEYTEEMGISDIGRGRPLIILVWGCSDQAQVRPIDLSLRRAVGPGKQLPGSKSPCQGAGNAKKTYLFTAEAQGAQRFRKVRGVHSTRLTEKDVTSANG